MFCVVSSYISFQCQCGSVVALRSGLDLDRLSSNLALVKYWSFQPAALQRCSSPEKCHRNRRKTAIFLNRKQLYLHCSLLLAIISLIKTGVWKHSGVPTSRFRANSNINHKISSFIMMSRCLTNYLTPVEDIVHRLWVSSWFWFSDKMFAWNIVSDLVIYVPWCVCSVVSRWTAGSQNAAASSFN